MYDRVQDLYFRPTQGNLDPASTVTSTEEISTARDKRCKTTFTYETKTVRKPKNPQTLCANRIPGRNNSRKVHDILRYFLSIYRFLRSNNKTLGGSMLDTTTVSSVVRSKSDVLFNVENSRTSTNQESLYLGWSWLAPIISSSGSENSLGTWDGVDVWHCLSWPTILRPLPVSLLLQWHESSASHRPIKTPELLLLALFCHDDGRCWFFNWIHVPIHSKEKPLLPSLLFSLIWCGWKNVFDVGSYPLLVAVNRSTLESVLGK
jgi:hypothetical protein